MVLTELPIFGQVRLRRAALTAVMAVIAMCALGVSAAGAESHSSLHQKLAVNWRNDHWLGHSRARFAIPGIGAGEVQCKPNTTWIRMLPADTGAENSMWNVKLQIKDGVSTSAVKDVRVYRFSTPTSTVPHGSGSTAYEGFNQRTPIESAGAGTMVGLISKRGARNASGGPGVAPTSFRLSWSWTGFGTAAARCNVNATFTTRIIGRSRSVSTGGPIDRPSSPSPAYSFNLNWHGDAEVPTAAARPHSLAVPAIGVLAATCQPGIAGQSYLTLTPAAGTSPFASVVSYQGEGIHNSVQTDYYTDPISRMLGPIPLPVNGMLVGTLQPAWYASDDRTAQLVVSSLRKTNDPDPAGNYCEVSAQVAGPA